MPLRMLRSPLEARWPDKLAIMTWPVGQKMWSMKPTPFSLLHMSLIVLLVACTALFNHGRSAVVPDKDRAGTSRDLANPIASIYPNNATGVLNATLVIVPISLESARRLIPRQYGILEQAYRSLMPDFPDGMYPVLLQAAHDHDIQLRAFGFSLDDFSRVGLEFPFLDLLGDGYSSFRWAPAQLISADHEMAVHGSREYGTEVSPAEFEPPYDAYEHGPDGTTYFRATTSQDRYAELTFSKISPARNPYPMALFRNITNQPIFANGSTCDNMIRLFNSSMSAGVYEPVPVQATVRANLGPWREEVGWTGVYGIQIATPFVENNYLDCRTMQGYTGTGVGDSSA